MGEEKPRVLVDGSRIMIESCVAAGAEVFVGYPITPANYLYHYATQRFPVFLPAPDEITSLQWMAGFSAAGRLPVTATSFPGFALMVETLNMAFMMELPMVIILAQRLGPSTGSATTGAQGDLLLLRGSISGGHPLPVLCPSDFRDAWLLPSKAVATAVELRTPVILLTSKEMIMTDRSIDLSELPPIAPQKWSFYGDQAPYRPYAAGEGAAPPFLPVGSDLHQVRLNASTHDASGAIRKATPEAMDNTSRLRRKIESRVSEFTYQDFDRQEGSDTLLVTYGITSDAVRDAAGVLRARGRRVSCLIAKTLLPVPPELVEILSSFEHVILVEENLSGSFREILCGRTGDTRIRGVNAIGRMITPQRIVAEVEGWQKAC